MLKRNIRWYSRREQCDSEVAGLGMSSITSNTAKIFPSVLGPQPASYFWYQLLMLLFWLDQAIGCLLWSLAKTSCEGKDQKSKICNWPTMQHVPKCHWWAVSAPYHRQPSHKRVTILPSHLLRSFSSGWGIEKEKSKDLLWQTITAFFHYLIFHISTTVRWFVQDLEIRI